MERSRFVFIYLLSLASRILNQGVTDNRCYLENGASSESFFVSEDLPIGDFVGQIRVHGDPRPSGSIALYLRETDSPVTITSGTKNLTLRNRLDKEGIDGPSSVLVNLICERLHTLDPGFVIPINIRVSDANDNAPVFINAPYELNISEVTVVGTRVLQGVHAIDADQQGPYSSIRYSILPGRHSDYFEFENELEGTLVLRKPLDYETLKQFDVEIRAQDHGEPPKSADTTLTVHVVDADDQNPKFLEDRYMTIVPDSALKDEVLNIRPKSIRAFDQDLGINAPVYYTFNGLGGDYSLFKLNMENARVSLRRDLTDNDLIHPATLVIRATQQDNPDRYALVTLTASRMTTKGLRFLKRIFYIKVAENQPVGTVVATFANNRPGQALRYFVSEESLLKVFAINTKGELTLKKRLDYEEKGEYYFKIFATDGITNDSSVVNITIEDINEWEPRFRRSHYEFFVSDEPSELVGRVEAADGDKNDVLNFTLVGMNASVFSIRSNGEIILNKLENYYGMASFTILATDSGNPPRRASVPVTVHFPPSPDAIGMAKEKSKGAHLLLAGLAGILLVLAFVVVLLIVYICRARKRNIVREQLPTLPSEKSPTSSASSAADKVSNPMFADRMRSPTASAMGGIPTEIVRSRIPSPKIHPAPQPPIWPSTALANRAKKLSWGDDKTDSDSTDNMNNIDVTPKTTETTNLTVYF